MKCLLRFNWTFWYLISQAICITQDRGKQIITDLDTGLSKLNFLHLGQHLILKAATKKYLDITYRDSFLTLTRLKKRNIQTCVGG